MQQRRGLPGTREQVVCAASEARRVVAFAVATYAVSCLYLASQLMPNLPPRLFEPGSLSFELVKGLPPALVVAVVACVAAWVAWHQLRVARAKLNLDLFERRLPIFDAVWAQLSRVVTGGPIPFTGPDFTNLLPSARFLYGPEVEAYMHEIVDKVRELWNLEQATTAGCGPMAPDDMAKHLALMRWFHEEASSGCKKKFEPYLDFSLWRGS